MFWFEQEGWEYVPEGDALDKVHKLIGHDDFEIWSKKYGRKTVFLRHTGVMRLYVVDDNGIVHMDKHYTYDGLDVTARDLIDRAMKWGKYDVAI